MRTSACGWSSPEVPLASSTNRGSTNETAGSVPAAQSWRNDANGRLIGSSRYYGYEPESGEIEIGWTFLARSHWGGAANREVKGLMLDHAFTFADTVVFWVGEQNWRSQGAMTKIGGIKREGLFTRELSGAMPYCSMNSFLITRASATIFAQPCL